MIQAVIGLVLITSFVLLVLAIRRRKAIAAAVEELQDLKIESEALSVQEAVADLKAKNEARKQNLEDK